MEKHQFLHLPAAQQMLVGEKKVGAEQLVWFSVRILVHSLISRALTEPPFLLWILRWEDGLVFLQAKRREIIKLIDKQ